MAHVAIPLQPKLGRAHGILYLPASDRHRKLSLLSGSFMQLSASAIQAVGHRLLLAVHDKNCSRL